MEHGTRKDSALLPYWSLVARTTHHVLLSLGCNFFTVGGRLQEVNVYGICVTT